MEYCPGLYQWAKEWGFLGVCKWGPPTACSAKGLPCAGEEKQQGHSSFAFAD